MIQDNTNAANTPVAEGDATVRENWQSADTPTASAPDESAVEGMRHERPLNRFDPNRVDEDEDEEPGADLDQRVLDASVQRGVGPMTLQDVRDSGTGTIGYGEKDTAGPGGLLGVPMPPGEDTRPA